MHPLAKPDLLPISKFTLSRANSQRGATDLGKPSYPPVEAIQRGFNVLRAVNHFRIASVNDINFFTKYPKPSIVRVLETLVGEGYVARDNLCGGYRVTSKAAELCAGHQGIASLIECARPFAVGLTNGIKWPVSIGVLDRDAIVIQFSTAPISPLAQLQLLGQRHHLFSTAMGRAYLAFCSTEEREALIATHGSSEPLDLMGDQWRLRTILPMVRDQGFALGEASSLDRTIALPVFHANSLAAIASLDYYDSVVPREEIRDKLISPLRDTIRSIEASLADSYRTDPEPRNAAAPDMPRHIQQQAPTIREEFEAGRSLPILPSYVDLVEEPNA
jgi:IclR family transcriptional regulator, mhp operon transcriptional activator